MIHTCLLGALVINALLGALVLLCLWLMMGVM